VSVVVDLGIFVEHPLLRPHVEPIVAQISRDEVLHIGHCLEQLHLGVVVLNLVGHGFLADGSEAE